MMTMPPTHRHFFISDLEWLLMTPVINSPFRLYRDDNGKPAGVIFWASLSEEVKTRLNSGATKLALQDWKSGDRLWGVDVIDLIGGKMPAMIEDMRRTVFKGKTFKFQQTQPNGQREVLEVKG